MRRWAAVAGLPAAIGAVLIGLVVPATAAAEVPADAAGLVATYPAPGVATVLVTPGGRDEFTVAGRDGAGNRVTADTPFRIASMSKAFTATAVLQLAETGRLLLDQPVVDLVPGFDLADPRDAEITVRHLLSHTSGITGETFAEFALPPAGDAGAVVARMAGTGLASDPGSTFAYANANYSVAARVVEVTTGQSSDDYLREHVFQPLGMTATTATARCDVEVPGLARGYVGALGVRFAAPELPGDCAGNGGVVTTARDMARWLRFQTGDGTAPGGTRLLSAAAMREMRTPQASAGRHGLGWEITTAADGREIVGHSGAIATYSSDIRFTADGRGAVALTNAIGAPGTLTAALLGTDDVRVAASADPFTIVNVVLLGLAIVAAVLLLVTTARAPRWARRHHAGRTVARRVPLALVVVAGVLLPWALAWFAGLGASSWQGWALLLWFLPLADVLALVLVVGGVLALIARTVELQSRRRDLARQH